MNLVVEGPDGAGKSTLVSAINQHLMRTVIPSEGREKWPGEMYVRIGRYAQMDDVIFDRHPCVSQTIYSLFNGTSSVDLEQIRRFYATRPLIIYCRSVSDQLGNHNEKGHDSPEHLAAITANHRAICHMYDGWAMNHARILFRIGDRVEEVVNLVSRYLQEKH